MVPEKVEADVDIVNKLLFPVEVNGEGRQVTKDGQPNFPQSRSVQRYYGQSLMIGHQQEIRGRRVASPLVSVYDYTRGTGAFVTSRVS